MRKTVLILFAVVALNSFGNTVDSLKIVRLQREMTSFKSTLSNLRQEDAKLHDLYKAQAVEVDSIKAVQQNHGENLSQLAEKIGIDLTEANKKIDTNVGSLTDSIQSRTWIAIGGIILVLALLAIVYALLRNRINSSSSSLAKIRAAQESLETAQKAMQEESVKLDNKLVELLDRQLATQPAASSSGQTDHSLAMKVADEIVRIETNLARMDNSVKGYKQLAKAIERIRTNFLANGYEIVDMLGKPYNEGMKVVANFVSDDTLADGEQKITGIIKPQINYKGKMIQSAQITVSQNL